MTSRFNRVAYIVILALTLATAYLLFDSVTDRLARTEEGMDAANSKVTALSNQVEDLGEKPIVNPAPVVVFWEAWPGADVGSTDRCGAGVLRIPWAVHRQDRQCWACGQ